MTAWYDSMKGMPLTKREQQILDALTTPATYTQIGAALGISRDTVRTHAVSLHRKLGVQNRIQLLIAAEQAGLVQLFPAA